MTEICFRIGAAIGSAASAFGMLPQAANGGAGGQLIAG